MTLSDGIPEFSKQVLGLNPSVVAVNGDIDLEAPALGRLHKLNDAPAPYTTHLLSASAAEGRGMAFVGDPGLTKVVTIDPYLFETISGRSSLQIRKNEVAYIHSDGAQWLLMTGSGASVGGSNQEDYISGLKLRWNSPGTNGTNITCDSGAAWVPSLNRILDIPSTLTGPSMTWAASTFYYAYVYDNAGTPALEFSTTAPAAAYKGTARTKTGDTSRRYVGALKSNAAGTPAILNFKRIGDMVRYTEGWNQTLYQLFNFGATANTLYSPSLSGYVPPTSRLALIMIYNPSGDISLGMPNPADGSAAFLTAPYGIQYYSLRGYQMVWTDLDASLSYSISTTITGTIAGYIRGYYEER